MNPDSYVEGGPFVGSDPVPDLHAATEVNSKY